MLSLKQQAIERADASDIIRFWKFVQKTDYCWIWTGEKDHDGRAHFSVDSICVLAARFAYNTFVEKIPDKLLVLHTCDNVLCVNFERHLFLGTHANNRQDCAAKNRTNSDVPHPGVSGTKNGRSKLSQEDLDLIRSLLPMHRDCDILRIIESKINKKQMSYIRRGWSYRNQ